MLIPARGTSFLTDEAAIKEMVRLLVVEIDPHAIYLFGSRARDSYHDESDFDLLVITRVSDGEAGRDYTHVLRPLKNTGINADVVPVRLDDFAAEMESDISMIPSVMGYARELYREPNCPTLPIDRTDGT